MTSPRISLLMPVFNGEKYVRSTLDTVVNQSFTDWEAIIMDGGSKDRTVEIAKTYAEKYPNIRIYSEPDEGFYHAFHKAAAVAKGEFLVEMCFSDGYLDKDWFKKCIEVMDGDKEVSLVWGIPFDMTEEGKLLGPNYIFARFLRDDIRAASLKTPIAGTILKKIYSPAKLIKKINPATVRSAFRMLHQEEVPQKENWFLYWLKMGTIFPDLTMFMSRKAFFECMDPYHMGSREGGDWGKFYYNFGAKGFLAYCLPIPAIFARSHGDQLTLRIKEYNDNQHQNYLRRLREFAKEVSRHPDTFMFLDREGKPIMSLSDFKKTHKS
jgi:glycosyltransferase involved in cell wall biosynthesis